MIQRGHLTITTIDPERTPLPITEIGYLSWFTSPQLVEDSGGPVVYVLQSLEADGAGLRWQQDAMRQLDLFH